MCRTSQNNPSICIDSPEDPQKEVRKAHVLYDYDAKDVSELSLIADEVSIFNIKYAHYLSLKDISSYFLQGNTRERNTEG